VLGSRCASCCCSLPHHPHRNTHLLHRRGCLCKPSCWGSAGWHGCRQLPWRLPQSDLFRASRMRSCLGISLALVVVWCCEGVGLRLSFVADFAMSFRCSAGRRLHLVHTHSSTHSSRHSWVLSQEKTSVLHARTHESPRPSWCLLRRGDMEKKECRCTMLHATVCFEAFSVVVARTIPPRSHALF